MGVATIPPPRYWPAVILRPRRRPGRQRSTPVEETRLFNDCYPSFFFFFFFFFFFSSYRPNPR